MTLKQIISLHLISIITQVLVPLAVNLDYHSFKILLRCRSTKCFSTWQFLHNQLALTIFICYYFTVDIRQIVVILKFRAA